MNYIQSRLSRLALAALAAVAVPCWTACNDLSDDDHYGDETTRINNADLKIVQQTSQDYIKSRPDFAGMNRHFIENGIFDELQAKGQLSTILMVAGNDVDIQGDTPEEYAAAVRSHISDVSMSPSNLHDGDRIMMWHGKYVNVTIPAADLDIDTPAAGTQIYMSGRLVSEIIKTTNGYIYVIDGPIVTPTSLYDYIEKLGDDYSIYRELVKASGGKIFDRANSKPVRVNEQGNTEYDSVFIYTNAHFDNVGFNMNSESLTATMVVASNEVINAAIEDAHQRLAAWDMERDDQVLLNWILDATFFNRRYSVEQLSDTSDPDKIDINTIFSKQWRKGAHTLDADASVELSNAVVHQATKLHIPNNVLMYRLKDWFYYYESCTDQQKTDYFKMTNMVFSKCEVGVAAWSPLEGVWPQIEDRALLLGPGDDGQAGAFRLEFTPIRMVTNEDGITEIKPYLIPPGGYRLAFGSKQNQNLDIYFTVLVNGVEVAKSPMRSLGTTTEYHYDRGGVLSDRYPEGYNPSDVTAMGGSSKASNYDTDGGRAIDEVIIPDDGTGKAYPIVIRIDSENWKDNNSFTLNHWCLRPTVNNY